MQFCLVFIQGKAHVFPRIDLEGFVSDKGDA